MDIAFYELDYLKVLLKSKHFSKDLFEIKDDEGNTLLHRACEFYKDDDLEKAVGTGVYEGFKVFINSKHFSRDLLEIPNNLGDKPLDCASLNTFCILTGPTEREKENKKLYLKIKRKREKLSSRVQSMEHEMESIALKDYTRPKIIREEMKRIDAEYNFETKSMSCEDYDKLDKYNEMENRLKELGYGSDYDSDLFSDLDCGSDDESDDESDDDY